METARFVKPFAVRTVFAEASVPPAFLDATARQREKDNDALFVFVLQIVGAVRWVVRIPNLDQPAWQASGKIYIGPTVQVRTVGGDFAGHFALLRHTVISLAC